MYQATKRFAFSCVPAGVSLTLFFLCTFSFFSVLNIFTVFECFAVWLAQSFLPQRCRALFVATGRSQKGSSRKRRTSMFSPTGPISSSEDEDSLGDPLDGVVPRRGFFCELLLRRREDPHRISILSQILGLVSELHPSESAMKKISTQGIVGLPARVAAFQRLFRTKRGGDDVIDFREGIGQIKRHGALLE